jgi:putative transposase
VSFCVSALEEALARFGKPEIFNTDQGSQFTSAAFTGTLAAAGIRISMTGAAAGSTTCSSSGCGAASSTRTSTSRATPTDARRGPESPRGFNARRPHQALGNRTPIAVWREGTTGALDATAVDMTLVLRTSLDNAGALLTCPPPPQQQEAKLRRGIKRAERPVLPIKKPVQVVPRRGSTSPALA